MPPHHHVTFSSFGTNVNFCLPEREHDHIQKIIANSKNFYEIDLLMDVYPRISKQSLVVDVGANIGNHTIFFSKVCGAQVVALEPFELARQTLLDNISVNGVEHLVQVIDAAAGAFKSTGDVEVISANNIGQTMIRDRHGDSGRVKIITLDELLNDREVSLIKIDTEGMELEVLRGAEETIKRCRPIFYIEAQSNDRLAMLEQLMSSFNYVVIDRFASTPTYLFTHISDEKQRHLSIIHRAANINRDVRALADVVAKTEKVRRSDLARVTEGQVVSQQMISELTELAGAIAASAKLNGAETVAVAEGQRRSEELLGDARQRIAELDSRIETSFETITESLNWTPLSKDVQVVKELTQRIELEHRNEINRLQELSSRLRYERDAFRKKVEAMYRSFSWRTGSRIVAAVDRLTFSKHKPLSARQYFEKIKEGAPKPKKHASPVAVSPVYPDSNRLHYIDERLEKTFAGIASIPTRREALQETISSLLTQVDEIGVYLNDWDHVPSFLDHPKIRIARSQDSGDIGDAGKFFWVGDYRGFYFTCDDDIIYPADYVQRLKMALKKAGYRAAVGWHGSMIKGNFTSYYTAASRRVFGFQFHRPWDTPVHILGTGCMAFHTDAMKVSLVDFPEPNMADVFFAILGQKQRVPFIVVKHEKGELIEVPGTQDSSIQADSRAQKQSKKDTGIRQTELIHQVGSWRTFEWRPLRIGVIGRFGNFTKGGIFKSCNLIAASLRKRGHFVVVHDTQEALSSVDSTLDLVWIYPGDPTRPDFASVDEKIEQFRSAGIPIIVNLSYLYEPQRSKWIAGKLKEYNSRNGLPPVLAAVFAESVLDDPALADVKDHLIFVPKTIEPAPADYLPDFHEREGICFGDSTKLSNPNVVGGSCVPWIDAVLKRLPHVSLYAFKQYSGPPAHKHLETVPYMTDGFGNFLAGRRLFINLNVHLTFEMVGCEVQNYGTPVLYRHMPHSLSEYIGPTGIRVRQPEELGELAAWLYNDESAWRDYSQASKHNGAAISYDVAHASLEAALRIALVRIRTLRE